MSLKYIALFCFVALAYSAPRKLLIHSYSSNELYSCQFYCFTEPAQKNICLLSPVADDGKPCTPTQEIIAYYYDPRTRDCEEILYTGCGGTANLFPTEEACEYACDRDSFDFLDIFDIFDK